MAFANDALKQRAQMVEVTLREGGCAGPTVFTTEVTRSMVGQAPGALPKGRYGFSARARDAACLWFAEGCSEATLPSNTSLTVVMSESRSTVLDPGCDPQSLDGSVSPDGNVGPPLPDAQVPDAFVPGPDSGVPDGGSSFDERAPKCVSPPADVVACFDFDGTLEDASNFGNDATGDDASFESSLSGQALRVAGTRVSVADDASLNFDDAFSIEVWFRSDALENLNGEAGAISLLLDKDQQYDLGIHANGQVAAEVYSAVQMASDFTATDTNVVVGEFDYIAWVYDGANIVLYQNGQRRDVGRIDLTPFSGNGGTLHIGTGSPNLTRPFDGLIDALRMWNRVLSDAEICAAVGRELEAGVCPGG